MNEIYNKEAYNFAMLWERAKKEDNPEPYVRAIQDSKLLVELLKVIPSEEIRVIQYIIIDTDKDGSVKIVSGENFRKLVEDWCEFAPELAEGAEYYYTLCPDFLTGKAVPVFYLCDLPKAITLHCAVAYKTEAGVLN